MHTKAFKTKVLLLYENAINLLKCMLCAPLVPSRVFINDIYPRYVIHKAFSTLSMFLHESVFIPIHDSIGSSLVSSIHVLGILALFAFFPNDIAPYSDKYEPNIKYEKEEIITILENGPEIFEDLY